jgi:hypothetical protein
MAISAREAMRDLVRKEVESSKPENRWTWRIIDLEDTLDYGPEGTNMNQSNRGNEGAASVMRVALLLAIVADLTQIIVVPVFIGGIASPAEDLLDLCLAGLFSYLLGWHWEFLPSFLGKLVPGMDLVPLWTLAVANIYRTSRKQVVTIEGKR